MHPGTSHGTSSEELLKAALRVGLLTARLVTMEFAHPWVVQSFKLLRHGREKLEPFNRSIDRSRKEAAAAAEAPAESAEEPGSLTRSKLTSISQDEQSEEPGPFEGSDGNS